MAFFPIFIDLEEKQALVIGAGIVGKRRIQVLTSFGARVTVVSPHVDNEIKTLAKQGKICLALKEYQEYRKELKNGLSGFFILISATGISAVDKLAAEDGRAAGILVNVAGDKRQSDFYFPGIAREGIVTAGIVADGADHKLAKQMTEQVRKLLKEVSAEEVNRQE